MIKIRPSITTHCQGWQRSDKVLLPVTSEWQSRVLLLRESAIKVIKIFHACALHERWYLAHIGCNMVFLCYSSLSPLSMGRIRGPGSATFLLSSVISCCIASCQGNIALFTQWFVSGKLWWTVLAPGNPNSRSRESAFHSRLILTGDSQFREFSFFLVNWILPTEAILVPYDVYQLIGSSEISNKERVKITTKSQRTSNFSNLRMMRVEILIFLSKKIAIHRATAALRINILTVL